MTGMISEMTVKTMDSREIAELARKQHAHVCRDIQEMLGRLKGFNQSSFGSVYTAGNGEQRRCYKLPFRETMILVSGYSVELRSRIVDRWIELEGSTAPALPDFTNPVIAARAWADEVEAKLRAQSALAEAAPKVAVYEAVMSSKEAVSMNKVAKMLELGMGRNQLFAFLRDHKVLMSDNTPYQAYMDRGYFAVKESHWIDSGGSPQAICSTLVYQKGIEFIRELILDANRLIHRNTDRPFRNGFKVQQAAKQLPPLF
ncbi:MAG: phage regulatory protein/antirepressor Ant [Candidatus Atribacteria bacterium]|nr:phage regulatory protein/antirepressor Ant [Candidatus Atribacteria bacterium]